MHCGAPSNALPVTGEVPVLRAFYAIAKSTGGLHPLIRLKARKRDDKNISPAMSSRAALPANRLKTVDFELISPLPS